MRRLALLFAVICGILSPSAPAAGVVTSEATPWRELLLVRTELPAELNALVRWQPLFPQLFPEDPATRDQLQVLSSPLENPPDDADSALKVWLACVAPALTEFTLRENETLQLPALRGPETPFPDHQPLRQLATVRTAALKRAWRDQRHDDALALAVENLASARVLLSSQEGLIPLLNASGVWQLALDGVYWLARQPDLTPTQAARLQAALLRDERLAAEALQRAFRGEFTFFTRVVLDRLPLTDNVDLLLSSIGSLGMVPPTPPNEGEPRVGAVARPPLDREATLQAAADDVSGWLDAFIATGRHPLGFGARQPGRSLGDYAREIPELLRYSTQDTLATAEQIARVDAEIAAVDNPVGKLFLVITTSHWEPLSVSVFRREAQRSALTALLAWRRLGRPAPFAKLVAEGVLSAPPADPFSAAPLLIDLVNGPRIWSVGENGEDDGGAGDGENVGRPLDLAWPAIK